MSASQIDFRANCLKLADYLDNVPSYCHDRYGLCGSPACAWGWACHSEMFGLKWFGSIPSLPGMSSGTAMDELFGPRSHQEIFATWNNHIKTAEDAARELRNFADKYYPATKEFPSGAEVVKAILAKPFTKKELSDVA